MKTTPFEASKLLKPVVIVANGISYLGQFVEKDGKLSLSDAMPMGNIPSVGKTQLSSYCVTAVQGKLTKLTVNGNSPWSVQELDEDLTIEWNVLIMKLEQAIAKGPINSIVEAFLRGN